MQMQTLHSLFDIIIIIIIIKSWELCSIFHLCSNNSEVPNMEMSRSV